MYRYVSSPKASKYIVPPPQHRELSSIDVPESELEMREILNNWFADGLAPIIENEDLLAFVQNKFLHHREDLTDPINGLPTTRCGRVIEP